MRAELIPPLLAYHTMVKGGPAPTPPGTDVVLDTFTGADSTDITARNPDTYPAGSSWSAPIDVSGDITAIVINGNKAVPTAGGSSYGITVIESGLYNCKVTVKATNPVITGRGFGLAVRYVDASNHWRVELWTNNTNKLLIREVTAGTETSRAEVAKTIASGSATEYTLEVTLNGNTISAVCGAESVSYDSASHNTATKHGLFVYYYNNTTARSKHDDFLVETI